MGVKGTMKKYRPHLEIVDLSRFAGKAIAIDNSVWMHQALRRIDGDVFKFYKIRIQNLVNHRIRPIFIFDGKPPFAKLAEIAKRKLARERYNKSTLEDIIKEDLKSKEEDGSCEDEEDDQPIGKDVFCEDKEVADKYFAMESEFYKNEEVETDTCQTDNEEPRSRNTFQMIMWEWLVDQGFECIMAFNEADFIMALLELLGITAATITIDTDLVMLGCKNIIFSFFLNQAYLYTPKTFKAAFKAKFNADLFRPLAVLIGHDYLPGGLKQFGIQAGIKMYQELINKCNGMDGQEVADEVLAIALKNPKYKQPENFINNFHEAVDTLMYHPVFVPGEKRLRPFIEEEKGLLHFQLMVMQGGGESQWDWSKAYSPPKEDCKIKAAPGSAENTMCPVCNEIIKDIESYKTHVAERHVTRLEECIFCGKCFTDEWKLNQHLLSHTQEKPWFCSKCDASFSCKANLKTHYRIHSGVKPYKCDRCDAAFSDARNFQVHIRRHNGVKPYSCDVCGKEFAASNDLKIHTFIHLETKDFKCDVCGEAFVSAVYLGRHKVIHLDTKPHVCSICSKGFNRKAHLEAHMTKHTGAKDFACPKCTKTFATKDLMRGHLKIVHEEGKFVCSKCGKKFKTSSKLKRHNLVHTKEQLFSCAQCGKKFGLKENLNRHMLIHTR